MSLHEEAVLLPSARARASGASPARAKLRSSSCTVREAALLFLHGARARAVVRERTRALLLLHGARKRGQAAPLPRAHARPVPAADSPRKKALLMRARLNRISCTSARALVFALACACACAHSPLELARARASVPARTHTRCGSCAACLKSTRSRHTLILY